jgi:3-hydroxyacyl-CoA dehydrogenase
MEQIAIIGTGLIGRAWAMVFARAGHSVRIWDPVAGVSDAALGLIGQSLQDLAEAGLINEAAGVIAARISAAASMEYCVAGAVHVQENGPERVEPKRALFARLDALCGPDVVLASSTSGIPASVFTGGLAGRARCLVTHPVNPPYLVPLVELVGAPWTAPEVVAQTHALMARVGQVPVTAMKETRGFVLNRLQAALVAETFRRARVTAERRAVLPLEKIGERSALRHRRLMRVLGHKRKAKE